MTCYYLSTEVEPGVVINQRVQGEMPTNPRTVAAVHAVIKAAYKELERKEPQDG